MELTLSVDSFTFDDFVALSICVLPPVLGDRVIERALVDTLDAGAIILPQLQLNYGGVCVARAQIVYGLFSSLHCQIELCIGITAPRAHRTRVVQVHEAESRLMKHLALIFDFVYLVDDQVAFFLTVHGAKYSPERSHLRLHFLVLVAVVCMRAVFPLIVSTLPSSVEVVMDSTPLSLLSLTSALYLGHSVPINLITQLKRGVLAAWAKEEATTKDSHLMT